MTALENHNPTICGLFAVNHSLVAAVNAENVHDLLIHPADLGDLGIRTGGIDGGIAAGEKPEHGLAFGNTLLRILHLTVADRNREIDAGVDKSKRERSGASGKDHQRRQGNSCDKRFEFHEKTPSVCSFYVLPGIYNGFPRKTN